MDFKHINDKNDKHKTPKSEISILSKRISSSVACDSPFRNLPNFSTPPSRFSRIFNPFESHLIERLHLPTFSPSVFAHVSTPKTEENFRWTIDDISSLKPADIDETTISQHVFTEDPHVESLVQQKIDTFFSGKVIVPSPMHVEATSVPLVKDCSIKSMSPEKPKVFCDGVAQTILSLPPHLPKEVEDILKPYFNFNEDQQQTESDENIKDSSLYRQLFDSPVAHESESVTSSPALSTGLSPIQLSPFNGLGKDPESPCDMSELKECNLSPICRKSPSIRPSRSMCRLSFSTRMSVDASMVVPDVENQMSSHSVSLGTDESFSPEVQKEVLSDSTINWDMEYNHISILSPSQSSASEKMDVSNSSTPHSKIFTSQRKRLSHSFKDEENDYDKENEPPYENINRSKVFRNDVTDAGYHTQAAIFAEDSNWSSLHVFASTPSKHKK